MTSCYCPYTTVANFQDIIVMQMLDICKSNEAVYFVRIAILATKSSNIFLPFRVQRLNERGFPKQNLNKACKQYHISVVAKWPKSKFQVKIDVSWMFSKSIFQCIQKLRFHAECFTLILPKFHHLTFYTLSIVRILAGFSLLYVNSTFFIAKQNFWWFINFFSVKILQFFMTFFAFSKGTKFLCCIISLKILSLLSIIFKRSWQCRKNYKLGNVCSIVEYMNIYAQ